MSVKAILTEQGGKGGGSGIPILQSIEIITHMTKTTYYSGEIFDPTGLVIKASAGANDYVSSEKTVSYANDPSSFSFETLQKVAVIPNVTPITESLSTIKVIYSEGASDAEAYEYFTVNKSLASIAVTTEPTKTAYKYGETLSTAGMVVTATYSDDTTEALTGWTCSPENGSTLSTLGSQTLTISYTETARSITRTTTTSVTVSKADGQITGVSPSAPSITTSNYSTGIEVTVSHLGNGTITSATSNNPSAVMVDSYDGNTIVLKGDGSTAGSVTITVTISAGDYHEAVTDTFTASAVYWEFGAGEGETADAAWFAGLKSYLASNTGASLHPSGKPTANIVGCTKTVTLSTAVAGTTTHKIVVIGVDLDTDRSVTWQTLNGLATTTMFSSLSSDQGNYANGTNYHHSANLIYDGNANGLCKQYYNAFPGKDSIKAVSKGTCLTQVSGRNGTATYTTQNVWIPSEGEVGLDTYASLGYSNWTTSNGECTQGKKFQYPYYDSNTKRVKTTGDSGSADTWWTRGHASNYASRVCFVNSDGSANYYSYWSSGLFAPALVIAN